MGSPFSPRTRGCSHKSQRKTPPPRVFPAYAGMFLRRYPAPPPPGSFPRVRGDVPVVNITDGGDEMFSPRTRGCSSITRNPSFTPRVFPAYAGMFQIEEVHPIITPQFSPRTRGCSEYREGLDLKWEVFPAYAGMFRFPLGLPRRSPCFPRVRGDVPCLSIPG